jgi:hypothetical protein
MSVFQIYSFQNAQSKLVNRSQCLAEGLIYLTTNRSPLVLPSGISTDSLRPAQHAVY